MFAFVRRVLGRETMSDVATLFPDQFNAVRVILFRWFEAEFRRLPGMEQNASGVVAAQVLNYLTGEDLAVVPQATAADAHAVIEAVRDDIPEIAGNLMQQDRALREIVVHTLRMRLILNMHYRPEAAETSGLQERVSPLLRTYGAEFPEEPSPRSYGILVSKLVAWAQSAQFPGRA